ncbi:MAG: dihydrodipicolinate synthase family protein, partial [Proteobacteria bacterium]|nr:dihydrodipicolinate synthase family protein [Pseudomonadota bacterium]
YRKRGIIDSSFIRSPGLQIGAYTEQELTAIVERVGFSLALNGPQRIL